MSQGDSMVLVSARKRMLLSPLELVIRRCPVCLKDTEQDAFYVKDPDLSAEAMTPTTPQFKVIVRATQENKLSWYIMSRCRGCGHIYKVTAIPQYKMKEVKQGKVEEVNLALFCCDICYNELARYENAEIFIKLSEGKNVYLCEKHAAEVEKEKERAGSYAKLIDRFNVWRINDAMPKAVQLEDGTVVALVGDRGYMEQILRELGKSGETTLQELVERMRKESFIHKTKDLIEQQVKALLGLSLVKQRESGGLLKKKLISLTDEGKAIARLLS